MRHIGVLAGVLLASVLGASLTRGTQSEPSAAARGDTWPTPAPTASWSNKVPLHTGQVDHPYPYEPGVIQVIHAPGLEINALLAKYSLAGPATYANNGPFTDFDRRAGLDRSYRVAVPVGSERELVKLLAPNIGDFPYVGLFWIAPPQLDGP